MKPTVCTEGLTVFRDTVCTEGLTVFRETSALNFVG